MVPNRLGAFDMKIFREVFYQDDDTSGNIAIAIKWGDNYFSLHEKLYTSRIKRLIDEGITFHKTGSLYNISAIYYINTVYRQFGINRNYPVANINSTMLHLVNEYYFNGYYNDVFICDSLGDLGITDYYTNGICYFVKSNDATIIKIAKPEAGHLKLLSDPFIRFGATGCFNY